MSVLFLAVSAEIVSGTVAGVTVKGARPPGARGCVFAGVQRAHVGAVRAVVACRGEKLMKTALRHDLCEVFVAFEAD